MITDIFETEEISAGTVEYKDMGSGVQGQATSGVGVLYDYQVLANHEVMVKLRVRVKQGNAE